MLLTIDVGNTQTVIGLYGDGGASHELTDHWRLATNASRTSDELALLLSEFLGSGGYDWKADVSGVAISSGVPMVTYELRRMCERYLEVEPVVLGAGVKTGMPVLYDNPKEVGADRVANAVGAYDLYGGPPLVGGFGPAAALRRVELVDPRSVIGKTTAESIQSGTIYGYSAMVDGMCDRIEEVLGDCTVIATGGLADLIAPVAESIEHVEPWLTLHGLRLVWEKNRP